MTTVRPTRAVPMTTHALIPNTLSTILTLKGSTRTIQ